MKALDKKCYNAYKKYKELGQEEARIRKEKEELKALIEEGFGRALTVETPGGTILMKKEVVRNIPARVDIFYTYKEEVK